jgi:hypothetical protein
MIFSFFYAVGFLFVGLLVATILTRLAYALTERVAEAPLLDIFVSLFTWIPWVVGACFWGWIGLAGALVAQFLFLHAFCLIHGALRASKGRTLTQAQARLLGPVRNQISLLITTPAVLVFVVIRLAEIILYPFLVLLARLPSYRHADWVNLSRHKFSGLAGGDLLWCWYCDWMTGVWSLGGEMLRNVESFWCPIRFRSPKKNALTCTDFPDVEKWVPADATLEEAVKLFEQQYGEAQVNSWWGHPDRHKKS